MKTDLCEELCICDAFKEYALQVFAVCSPITIDDFHEGGHRTIGHRSSCIHGVSSDDTLDKRVYDD
jgi:hypothetical protein